MLTLTLLLGRPAAAVQQCHLNQTLNNSNNNNNNNNNIIIILNINKQHTVVNI